MMFGEDTVSGGMAGESSKRKIKMIKSFFLKTLTDMTGNVENVDELK